ncbi:MAG: ketoacyl-ACP synthase III [bacterium]|nr:ketoacyl-ACP synthase III [bacterium]
MPGALRSVGIVATGAYVPDHIMPNKDFEKLIDTTDEWIRERTGIHARRIIDPEDTTSDLASRAAMRCLEDADVDPMEVELMIVATSSPDHIQPPTACVTQGKIGALNAGAFDVNTVCSGFNHALAVGSAFVADGSHETVLVIGAEAYSRILDFTDRTSCVYFGDGAGAVLLRPVDEGYGLISNYMRADGTKADVIKVLAGAAAKPSSDETIANRENYFRMDGKAVWDFATGIVPHGMDACLKKAGLSREDLDFIITHQANVNIIEHIVDFLGMTMDQTHMTIEKYANTAAASIAVTLDEAVRLGKIKKGDIVGLLGFGGGLAWAANVLRWAV